MPSTTETTTGIPPATLLTPLEQHSDSDGDGVDDSKDNCFNPNPDQKDSDNDNIADACDMTPNGPVTGPTTPTGQTDSTTSTGDQQIFTKGPDGKCPTGTAESSVNVGVCVGPGTTQTTNTLPGGPTTSTTPKEGEAPSNPDGTCPAGSVSVGSSGNAGKPGTGSSFCVSNSTPAKTTTPAEVEVPKNPDGTCPVGSHMKAFGNGEGAIGGFKCVSDNPPNQTPKPIEAPSNPDGTCPAGYSPASGKTSVCKANYQVEVLRTPDGKCPTGSSEVGFGGKTGSNAPSGSKCISDNPPASTTTPAPTTTTTPVFYQYGCVAEQVSSDLPTCGTNVENDPNYYCHKFTEGIGAGETRCTRASVWINDPCWDDPKSFACANKIEFCNGHPAHDLCQAQTPPPPVTRQYNCIAEQASSKYPTCPGGVENDPSYLCFEQVGQTICSRGAYDPCVESVVSPACKLEQDFCNSNPTDPRQLCKLGARGN